MYIPDYRTIQFEHQERIEKAAALRQVNAVKRDLTVANRTRRIAMVRNVLSAPKRALSTRRVPKSAGSHRQNKRSGAVGFGRAHG